MMFYVFMFLPLPLIVGLSFYLNQRKIYIRSGNLYLVSFLEGLGAYLVILSLLLEGFIVNPVLQVLILIVGLFIIAYTKNNIDDDHQEIDVQLETAKNIMVIFSSTILLFYVMLSVFRFQPFYLQILYALLVVIIFNILTMFLKRWVSKLWDKLHHNLSMFVNFSAWYIYATIVLLALAIIFFNFPKVSVNQSFNLNHSQSYFAQPNGSSDLVNRYDSNLLIDIQIESRMDLNAYMNQLDDHVFIFVKDTLIVYDLLQDQMVYSGLIQNQVNGIDVMIDNEEINEVKYKIYCDDSDCESFDHPFEYQGVVYKYINQLIRIDQLSYHHTTSAIYYDDVFHLFNENHIDSRFLAGKDKPFVGFGDSNAVVTDVDNHQGMINFLQIEHHDGILTIEVFEIIEKNVDMVLPFYAHYRFGMLVFILMIGFVPISNYDKHRKII